MSACVSESPVSDPQPDSRRGEREDGRCREWGAEPGTAAYFECRATLDRERRDESRGTPPAQAPEEEKIGDGLALSICEMHARAVASYPIKRLTSKFVFPGREPRATLSFSIDKPGSEYAYWNVECKFRGQRMIDFKGD